MNLQENIRNKLKILSRWLHNVYLDTQRVRLRSTCFPDLREHLFGLLSLVRVYRRPQQLDKLSSLHFNKIVLSHFNFTHYLP